MTSLGCPEPIWALSGPEPSARLSRKGGVRYSQHMAPIYFGYGSNLNASDLDRWCVESGLATGWLRRVTRGWLPDHRLAFDHRSVRRRGGTLNVRRAACCAAPGVLFEVSGDGWAALDRKEGHGRGHYRRCEVIALTADGSTVPVVTYESTRPEAPMEPAAGYLDIVRQGYRDHGLAHNAVEAAAHGLEGSVDRIFVYGSLKRGGWLAHQLQPDVIDARDISIRGDLYDLGEYPGYRHGAGRVHGELCRVRGVEAVLARLDDIEGFAGYGRPDNLFRRVLVEPHGESEPAWAYLLVAPMRGPQLPAGRWPVR